MKLVARPDGTTSRTKVAAIVAILLPLATRAVAAAGVDIPDDVLRDLLAAALAAALWFLRDAVPE